MGALPNLVTLLRVPLGLLAAWAVLRGSILSALVLFLLAALTDFLDGALARRLRAETRMGAVLEPVADSLYVIPTLFALDRRYHFLDVPTVAGLVGLLALLALAFFRRRESGLVSGLHALSGLAYAAALAFIALRLAYEVSPFTLLGAFVFLVVALVTKRERAVEILYPRKGSHGEQADDSASG